MPRSNKQATVAKVPELPSLIALDTAVLGSKRPRDELVPDELRGDFVESELASELHRRWTDYAADALAQFDDVYEGDWQAVGHDIYEEFPQLEILETFGQKWKEHVEKYPEIPGWKIDDNIDSEDFEELVRDFLADYNLSELDTKEALRGAIEEFKRVVEKEVENA